MVKSTAKGWFGKERMKSDSKAKKTETTHKKRGAK